MRGNHNYGACLTCETTHIHPMLGRHHTEETKQKMSNNRERALKISKALKGRKFSDQHRAKLSAVRKGSIPWNKGIPRTEEVKRKVSLARMGQKLLPETKVKISVGLRRRWEDPEYRRKCSRKGERNSRYGATVSEETLRKKSLAMMGKYVGSLNPNWKGGKDFEPYDSAFNCVLKRQIKARDNNQCRLCGDAVRRLSIHHIDYNKHHSAPDNLVTLCKVCNSLMNGHRGFWTWYWS